MSPYFCIALFKVEVFQPVSTNFTLVGFTDDRRQGHIWILDQNLQPYHRIMATVNGSIVAVAGLYGFHDKSFASLLFVSTKVVIAFSQ